MLPIHSNPDETEPTIVGQKRSSVITNSPVVFGAPNLSSPQTSVREYFGRMLRYTQMDFDYTFAQMVYLCFAPNKVYQLTQYRKRTKGQWARDDPAFIVIQAFFLSAAGFAYGVCFGETMFDQFRTFVYFILGHFMVLGIVVSSLCIFIAGKYLRKQTSMHGAVQPMEWLYSFDVHCNAFFPLFLLTYVVQYFFLPLLYSTAMASVVAANILHLCAVCYYCYVVSLGYTTLPFIERAEVFMAPAVVFAIVVLILCLTGTNLTIVFVEWTTGVL